MVHQSTLLNNNYFRDITLVMTVNGPMVQVSS